MLVIIQCPNPQCARKSLRASTDHLHHRVRCLHCQTTFTLRPEHLLARGLSRRALDWLRRAGDALASLSPSGLRKRGPQPAPEADGVESTDLVALPDPPADPAPGHPRPPGTRSAGAKTADPWDAESEDGPPSPDPTAPLPPGAPRQVGRFQVCAFLGGGAFGDVFLASDPQLDRKLALKVPRRKEDEHRFRRFVREARSAARLSHPHIVPVYDAGQDGPHLYIASAFIPGGTLREAASGRRLDFRRTAAVVRDLGEALAYAHGLGVIHRDVKPANILLDRQGRPHLADFGLAYLRGSAEQEADGQPAPAPAGAQLTREGFIVGTAAYMAPEHARGRREEVQPSSDQYSLGVVLYELLCGRLPFEGPDAVILFNHRRTPPEPPHKVDPSVPPDLEAICLKAMAKKPLDRYATCQEMADDLRRFLEGEPVRARPLGPVERAARWGKREPALASAIGLATFLLLAVGLLSLRFGLAQKEHARSLNTALAALAGRTNELEKALDELKVSRQKAVDGQRKAEEARQVADERRREAQRETRRADRARAVLAFDRGRNLCEQQETGQGMVWLTHSRTLAAKAEDADLRRAIESNLAGWRRQLNALRGSHPHGGVKLWAAAYTPDGRYLFGGGETARGQGIAYLWDTRDERWPGRPLLEGAGGPIRAVAVAADPEDHRLLLLTGSDDRTARLWDAATTKELARFEHPDKVLAVAFDPKARTILTGCADGNARLWQLPHRGKDPLVTLSHGTLPVLAVAFSPDGKILTGCGDTSRGVAVLWDADSHKRLQDLPHDYAVHGVAFNPTGEVFATASGSLISGTAQMWDADTGRPLGRPLRHDARVYTVAFSPDGAYLLTGSQDRTARLWDVLTGRPVGQPLRHFRAVRTALFHPTDRPTVLTDGEDEATRVWEMGRGPKLRHTFPDLGPVLAAALSPDGKTLLTGSYANQARLWDATTGKPAGPPLPHLGPVWAVAFSPDGKQALTGCWDGKARLWDVEKRKQLREFDHPAEVYSIAFHPNKQLIATGCADGRVRVWDVRQKDSRKLPGGGGVVYALAFSPDGRKLLAGCQDGGARLWDTATWDQLPGILRHTDAVLAVAFSPDGKQVLTGYAGGARLWDAGTLGSLGAPFEHLTGIFSVAFAPDGRSVLTGGLDGAARLWDVDTRKELGPPWRHDGAVFAVGFRPGGRGVFTGGVDRTPEQGLAGAARLWDAPPTVAGGPEQLTLWAEVVTGIELENGDSIHTLPNEDWQWRRLDLNRKGGMPALEKALRAEWEEPTPAVRPPRPLPLEAGGAEPSDDPALLADYLPTDTNAVGFLNVRQVLDAPALRHAPALMKSLLIKHPEARESLAEVREILDAARINPLQDVSGILAVSAGRGRERQLVLVRGRFYPRRLRAALARLKELHPEQVIVRGGEFPVYQIRPGHGVPDFFATIRDGKTLVVAFSEKDAREAAAWGPGKKGPVHKEIREFLGTMDRTHSAWAVALPGKQAGSVLAWLADTGQVRKITADLTLSHDLRGKVVFHTAGREAAEKWHKLLAQALESYRTGFRDAPLKDVMAGIQLMEAGEKPETTIRIAVSKEVVEEVLKLLNR